MIHETLDTTRRLARCPAFRLLLAALLVVLVPSVAFLLGGWQALILVALLAALLAAGAYAARTGLLERVTDRR